MQGSTQRRADIVSAHFRSLYNNGSAKMNESAATERQEKVVVDVCIACCCYSSSEMLPVWTAAELLKGQPAIRSRNCQPL